MKLMPYSPLARGLSAKAKIVCMKAALIKQFP